MLHRSDSRLRSTGQAPDLDVNPGISHAQKRRIDAQRETARLMIQEANEQPPPATRIDMPMLTADDAAELLGLNVKRTYQVHDMISEVAADTRKSLGIASQAREAGFAPHEVSHIVRSGHKLAHERRVRGLRKASMAKKDVNPKTEAPGGGWEAIPKGRKGGKRRKTGSGGYEYWYPGQGVQGQPHPDEPKGAHKQHERGQPHPDVGREYSKLKDLADEHGFTLSGSPDSRHTMKDIARLKGRMTRAIAQKESAERGEPQPKDFAALGEKLQNAAAKQDWGQVEKIEGQIQALREQAKGGKGGDEDGGKKKPPETKTAGGEGSGSKTTKKKPAWYVDREGAKVRPGDAYDALVDKSGATVGHVDPITNEHVFYADDPLEDMPRDTSGLAPRSPEMREIQAQVVALQETLKSLDKQIQRAERMQYERLQQQGQAVSKRPSPSAALWFAEKVKSFTVMVAGIGVGAMLGGPVGAILGGVAAAFYNSSRQAEQQRAAMVQGVSKGSVYIDREGGDLLVSARDTAPDPLLKARDHHGERCHVAHPGMTHEDYRRAMDHVCTSDDPVAVRARALIVSGEPRRAALVKAIREGEEDRLGKAAAPRRVPRKGDKPAVRRSPRARRPTNVFGHRDGLEPGMVLQLRKADEERHGGYDSRHVEIIDGGTFEWSGNPYPNGHQLLKAVTGKDKHRLTMRRYFGLGTEDTALAQVRAGELRKALGGGVVTAQNRIVRVQGRLADLGIPASYLGDDPLAENLDLDPEQVPVLIGELGGDNG